MSILRKIRREILADLESIIIAVILALALRTYIVQLFKIPTGSMEPTLHGDYKRGDKILVNKFIYVFNEPERGDIVIFTTRGIEGLDGKKDYIKRLIGLPGEQVVIKDGTIYVNGKKTDNKTISAIRYISPEWEAGVGSKKNPANIPSGMYYFLGDNSRNSRDSRYWGFAPQENIKGKAISIWLPLNRMRILK